MIIVNRKNGLIRIDGVINHHPGMNYPWYLVCIGMGFETMNFLIKAMDESSVFDELADSNKYSHLITIENENEYIQKDREKYNESLKIFKELINMYSDKINDPDYLPINAQQDLIDLNFEINELIDWIKNSKDMEWDSNGPFNDQVSYLGNYSKMCDLEDIRLFTIIRNNDINWFAKKDINI
jgi:hypothetical protein